MRNYRLSQQIEDPATIVGVLVLCALAAVRRDEADIDKSRGQRMLI
jgi:hypothetical protein